MCSLHRISIVPQIIFFFYVSFSSSIRVFFSYRTNYFCLNYDCLMVQWFVVIRKTQFVIFYKFVHFVWTTSKHQAQLFSFAKFSLWNDFERTFFHCEFLTLLLTLYLIINFPFGILNVLWFVRERLSFAKLAPNIKTKWELIAFGSPGHRAKIKQHKWKEFLIFHYQTPVGLADKIIIYS